MTTQLQQLDATLPDGWRSVSVREVIDEALPGFACGERESDGVIQLRMHNVDTRGNLIWDEFIRVPCGEDKLAKYRLKCGDVVFNNTNSTELVGKSAYFEPRNNEPIVFSNHFTRLRPAPRTLRSDFLAYWLQYEWNRRTFEKMCDRWIGQSAVKAARLFTLSIPLPPLAEQERIAGILKEQLAAVERARAAAEAQLEAAKALPAAYLRDVFEGDEAKTWPAYPFGDFIKATRNGFGRRPSGIEEGPIVLRLADVSSGRIDLSDVRRGTLSDDEFEQYRIHKDELLFVRVNGSRDFIGRCIHVDAEYDDVAYNDHLIRVDLRSGLSPAFARLALSSHGLRTAILEGASTSAGQLTINQSLLASLPVPVPTDKWQATVVAECEERARQGAILERIVQEQLDSIEALPAALLRAAFQGKL